MLVSRVAPENWEIIENQLVRNFEFADFAQAMEFALVIGLLAEETKHHPEITFGWGMVIIKICTHDKGNIITQKDVDLAKEINIIEQEIGEEE